MARGVFLLASLAAVQAYDFRFSSSTGLFPSVFNLASHATIQANATCGQNRQEVRLKKNKKTFPTGQVYCTLTEEGQSSRCGVCDSSQSDKAHPPHLTLDGSDRWWQSPSLQYGPAYQSVTLTINLGQLYQVAYIILTAGVAPRPANWVLERSRDGSAWEPWQYHAQSDEQCWHLYGMEPRKGKPSYKDDDEVICTSYYSSLKPLEGGEVSISLVNERPGAQGPSRTLLEFTQARMVRLSFHGLQILNSDQAILADSNHPEFASVARKYFYSIKDITIGGQCPCHGHASDCPVTRTGDYECKCRHNTCGALCDSCCPMFNQKRWRPGKFISGNDCEMCQCFGHADECYFDPQVEGEMRSLNTAGKFSGGGVCLNCRDKTTGVNCERCLDGYYRPQGVSRFDPNPCVPCDCRSNGAEAVDRCYQDDELAHRGLGAGHCVCRPGFTGPKCDQCAVGFMDFPTCTPCPCSLAGTRGGQCDGECVCKKHATGPRCDRCQTGYFALLSANPEGCTECFCNGVTSTCDSASLGVEVLDHESGWHVTDISGRVRVSPYWSSVTSGLTIAQEDIGLDAYYWEAPPPYIGNRLVSYGQSMTVATSWHAGRGDTSGTPTKEPDVVIEGAGFRMGFGDSDYRGSKNATIKLVFLEHAWYHVPGGGRVSKHEFMQCLGRLERLLIRAKYHSDQLEGTLHTAAMEFGAEASLSLTRTRAVEKCSCPPGYTGLSCEGCGYGYTRLKNIIYKGICRECQCNGHAATCDPFTLECGQCEHNTVGKHCDTCAEGYYGNAKLGRPNDCHPCKCPLDVPSNNFSPTCKMATIDYDKYSLAPEEYICDACPVGYEGAHCGRCANGFYGNPLTIGDYCKPCRCSSNGDTGAARYCDHITGQCLACLGNTGGWNCDTCLPGFFGNPGDGFCRPCQCNEYGSKSNECDARTGQCQCKEKYVGRTCGQCRDGFGAIRAGCRQCNCDPVGAEGDFCDADTGQCKCKPGITGITCNQCLPLHFGFSSSGCQSCDCHPQGSVSEQCQGSGGICSCRPGVTGRRCDKCSFGTWGITSGKGCKACVCDPMGSENNDCDDVTGQCQCKPGVGGPRCDACLAGFWGISSRGCKKCQPCNQPGHICDPDTGRCVCPTQTVGKACERCAPGTWDYHPYHGCKRCRCHPKGAVQGLCDEQTGQCRCLEGFEGANCDRCEPGFYNFPNCRACNCDVRGTLPSACREGVCQCDSMGVCPCKAQAVGRKCASCSASHFGLALSVEDGCTPCFCFGRSRECTQAQYSWTQLVMSRRRELRISRGDSQLAVENGYIVVPGDTHDAVIGVSKLFDVPIYWRLPEMFLGDKVLSYNGFLRFSLQSNGLEMFSQKILAAHPLVFIQGNHNIRLRYSPNKISGSGRYEVRIHEDDWINVNNPLVPVSRAMLMIGLQSVQAILVRATEATDTTVTQLHGVSLDVARPSGEGAPRQAIGIEMCKCPDKYTGTSCQNPGKGYYRYYKESFVESEIIIDLVGESLPCMCNGRADQCDPDSGFCQDCRDHTAGAWCDICAPGFFGDPMAGKPCQPCECPSMSKNFAQTCYREASGRFVCECKQGYTGPRCDRCAYRYYGDPSKEDGECLPCSCNIYGSQSDQCETRTGQCSCVAGVMGRACDKCKPRHVLTKKSSCKNCDNGCVGELLDRVTEVVAILGQVDQQDLDPAPMLHLNHYRNSSLTLTSSLVMVEKQQSDMSSLITRESHLSQLAELNRLRADQVADKAGYLGREAKKKAEEAEEMAGTVDGLHREVTDMILYLEKHGRDQGSGVSLTNALQQASDFLKEIQSKDWSEVDIKTRTEMSNARLLYERIQKIIFGDVDVTALDSRTEKIEELINDLLNYLQHAQAKVREGGEKNSANNQTLLDTMNTCSRIESLQRASEEHLAQGEGLMKKVGGIFDQAKMFFGKLDGAYNRLQEKSSILIDREIGMSAVVEDYRTRYVLPCQANAAKLIGLAKRLEDMFTAKMGVDAGQAIQAANAYRRIIDALDEARRAAAAALDASILAYRVANPPGEEGLREKARSLRVKSEDLRQEAQGLWKNADDMGIQIRNIQGDLEKYSMEIRRKQEIIASVSEELDRHSFVSEYATAAKDAATGSLKASETAKQNTIEMQTRIKTELWARANELNSFSPEKLSHIPHQIAESQQMLQTVDKQAAYLERRSLDLVSLNEKVAASLKTLKSRIDLAKHAASSIKISITGDKQEKGTCLRSYSVGLTPSTHNEISLIYGIQGEERNSLLLYLPSSKKSTNAAGEEVFDFLALEMIDRKIRFVWNNGAGTQSITHNVEIETAYNLARQDTMWYKITAERIGNIGRLNVRKVRPKYDLPEYHKWEVGESPQMANVLDLQPGDRLWVGGAPNYYRSPDLNSDGRFYGVLYKLAVNKREVGLWDFVTNFGCRETHSGVEDQVAEHSCHSFSGRGYATQHQIRNYDSRYYAVSMEFRTFDQNALLVLVASPANGQYLALELRQGKVHFTIFYGPGATLEFTSKETYNSGAWVKIEAGRASRGGQETGVLRITFNGLREDFVDSLPSLTAKKLDLKDSQIYFGGVPPDFEHARYPGLHTSSLLGNLRGITTSNPGSNSLLNPLYNEPGRISPHYGVVPNCQNRIIKSVSFGGHGHVEVKSQPLRPDSSFGFTFRSSASDGLLVLSTFLGQPSGHLAHYYSVSLVQGKLALVFGPGATSSQPTSFITGLSYNDGVYHTLFVTKRGRKISVFIDDERADEGGISVGKGAEDLAAPSHGGLFIGGLPNVILEEVVNSNMAASVVNLVGTIQDFAFIDDVSVRIVAMNEPVSFFNSAIGRDRVIL